MWHIGWLVSTETNLTSELSHTDGTTVATEKEDGWEEELCRLSTIRETASDCIFREPRTRLLALNNSFSRGSVTPPWEAWMCPFKYNNLTRECGWRKRWGKNRWLGGKPESSETKGGTHPAMNQAELHYTTYSNVQGDMDSTSRQNAIFPPYFVG